MTEPDWLRQAREKELVVGKSVGVNVAALGAGAVPGQQAPAPGGSLWVVVLPLPPSANNLFLTAGRKRVKTPHYRAWLEAVDPVVKRLALPILPCRVFVTVVGKVRANRDLDNMLKPIGDSLVAAGVLPTDDVRSVRGWEINHIPGDQKASVVVTFEESER